MDVIIWASTVPSSSNIHDGIMPFIDLHWCSFLPASLHSLALQPLSLFYFPGIIVQQKADGLIGCYSCHSLAGWQCSHHPKVFAMHVISFLVWYPLFSDMGHHQVILASFLVTLLCCCQCCVSSISVNLLPKSSSKIITVDMWLDTFDCGSVAIDIANGLLSPYLVVDGNCRFHLSSSLLSPSEQCYFWPDRSSQP